MLPHWFATVQPLDWIALVLFLLSVAGYRSFLAAMLKNRADRLYLGKLQAYRNAWIETHSGDKNSIVVVQTLRNTIMAASFLASTSILLIMGAINLLGNLDSLSRKNSVFQTLGQTSPQLQLVKVLLIIITLAYSFFKFTNYIREVNYMSFILNIPKPRLDAIEGGDSSQLVSQTFLSSGIHFSMGMRGYYFLVPLLMWMFSPVLMIGAILLITAYLLRRDLAS